MLTERRRFLVREVLRGNLSTRKAAKVLRISRGKVDQLIVEYAKELDAAGFIIF